MCDCFFSDIILNSNGLVTFEGRIYWNMCRDFIGADTDSHAPLKFQQGAVTPSHMLKSALWSSLVNKVMFTFSVNSCIV